MRFARHAAEAELAVEAVRQAAALCRSIQRASALPALTKADTSPVTVADLASQALVAQWLQQAFPDDSLVAEEESAGLRDPAQSERLQAVTAAVASLLPGATAEAVCGWIDRGAGEARGRFWTLDPVDGTKGFIRGAQFVVALALIEHGAVVVGALGCPNLGPEDVPGLSAAGCIAVAVRGQGAWLTGLEGGGWRRLQVSPVRQPAAARLLRSRAPEHTDGARMQAIATWLKIERPPALMDSQAKYAVLAAGGGELIFRLLPPGRQNHREKIWDVAAGAIVVEEAGGRVSDLNGAPLDFSAGRELARNVGVLVSNGHLHAQALSALQACAPSEAA